MMSFEPRKFFADEATAMPTISQDVLTAMASQGVKTDPDSSVVVPDVKTESPPAPPVAEAKIEVPAPSPAAPSVEEKTQPAAVVTPPPAITAPATTEADWREQIKKVDANDILKELGLDEKMVGFLNKWRASGDIAEYLKAVTVDFSKMTPEQVMRHQLEQSYPEFSPADIEELYQAKVVEAYKLDPNNYSETEVKRGQLMLKADAKSIRESLQTKQQEYILSSKPPVPPVDTSAQDAAAYRDQQRTQYANYLTNSQATKDLLSSRRLVLGDGDTTFNYEIADPQQLLTILQQPEQYAQHVFMEDGSPVVDKQLFIAAAAIDHKGLIKQLIKHGRDIGAKGLAEQIENAKKPDGEITKPDNQPLTPAEALARSGVLTY